MNAPVRPRRGDVWVVDFGTPIGHKQGYERPAVIVSSDELNLGPAGVLVVVPITRTNRRVPAHVEIEPPEGGVKTRSFITPEDIRSVSIERFGERWGHVSAPTLAIVEDWLRTLLDL
jgi:mRNA interferase MazF